MEQLAEKISQKMMDTGIIQAEKQDAYCYSIQMFLEKMTGILIILVFAIVSGKVVEISIFFLFFANIRRYAGGFHCKTFLECLILSVVSVIGLSGCICPILQRNSKWNIGLTIVSLLTDYFSST